jgi:hypothetical protein
VQYFSLLHNIETDSAAHATSCPMGKGIVSPEAKRQGREADHLLPSSEEVKKDGVIYLNSAICLHGIELS